LSLAAQQYEAGTKQKVLYNREDEIIYRGKRYRVHNNYLTAGAGFLSSSIRKTSQKVLGIDFQFHIVRQHFQAGVLMSGETIGSNNNVQAHIGYGYRKETKTTNLAFFAGPSWLTGVVAVSDSVRGTIPLIYENFGFYACAQAVTKATYDIGIGVEVFGEYSHRQSLYGVKLIFFFSGAYRGLKRNYNPNVRSENRRG
jgi:hypothetical protein